MASAANHLVWCAAFQLGAVRRASCLTTCRFLGVSETLVRQRVPGARHRAFASSVAAESETEISPPSPSPHKIPLPTNESCEELLRMRHTCAHVMAMAVQTLYPDAKVTIGPWIEKGFYYDFDLKEPLSDKDLKKIKKEMDRIIGRNLPLRREEVSREEAKDRIMSINEKYKLEILEDIKTEPITIYHIGNDWWDLCAGPHVERTGQLNRKAIELESVAGAYWRGDVKRQMLQRIYGTAWQTEEQLKAYQTQKEEAKRRDHRRLGQDLEIFSIQEDAGGGLVFWHPKGALIRHLIEDYWKKVHLRRGYELLYTPHIAKAELWKRSGHLDFYKENMFEQIKIEEEFYQLRPMNCPFHIQIYKDRVRSYRELPIKFAELGTVYRYELSGALHGLFRVRGFTQDDAHIFCLPEQIRGEIKSVLDLTEEILSQFGFQNYEINLSTKPEKAVGSDDIWHKATEALKDAISDKGWTYGIDEGGGAFYGPKIDLKIEDAIGRKWQCSTIQVDFNLPERFDLTYVDPSQARKQPIMIHRAIFGSIERFVGILIESYAGDFPLWIAPVQARLLPVTDTELPYCKQVLARLREKDIRAEIACGERLSKLIRNAEVQKIPLMAVVGPKEVEAQTLTVRTRHGGELGTLSVDEVIDRIETAVATRGIL
ncbi:threonine--tRNA ligase, chloroplastic/mitochondrial 2 [Selaginella moellendorffii]|uniref:threonine--tRNA ligase, chloroplastic/mitochondrial 2 n=1 Tax=Selaginella moellendorffii TaxID=88036 RepID=UPI000D1C4269|nr:threonine--tRNA ligase, chloroplastic/mitochondrial 2 [Selaginella moellendorffii]|eukprot:XP_024536368.1 threonine--tRNA ligase, chloroplastic/mitochondrial 2 [Selaginella moellendorffii]